MAHSARCYCDTHKCSGTLVAVHTKKSHERADLRRKSQSTIHSGRIFPHKITHLEPVPCENPAPAALVAPIFDFPDPPPVSPCAVEQEMLDHAILTQEDIDIQNHGRALPNLGPNFHTPEALLDAVDFYDTYHTVTAAGAQPLNRYHAHSIPKDPEQRAMERELEKALDEGVRGMDTNDKEDMDVDVDMDMADLNLDEAMMDDDTSADLIQPLVNDEDSPDPFEPDEAFFMSNGACAMSTIQPHLLTIYAVTMWLHLQWHLPRAACNALLSILGCLLLFVSPQLEIPFRTLQSATRVLALNTPFYTLPCCPTCQEVYPPTGSTHEQDHCMTCNIPLFLPDTTKRGFLRAKKIPYVKYPYLPLSVQIRSILTIPGVEATLNGWRSKP
ncbi:uncharacterized protein EDB91DRAFT_562970 [Suillus paluster]|uniref:uncharacterized protein n=1 Tax=Suillus paluster TaxID=48578 RepID=UPI001B878D02|nr:uncharacterized protein EDB91DRAFT_562970 [Suillus paluster]KAG1735327.1 hypothetical protein EDB91DRAFT_562970 [Suillus paluster]